VNRIRLPFLGDLEAELFLAPLNEDGEECYVSCLPPPDDLACSPGDVLRSGLHIAVFLGVSRGLAYFVHIDPEYADVAPRPMPRALPAERATPPHSSPGFNWRA
jgi:hypothetical protein